MALEVARAYDSNKNLVPLYILTDSDPVYDPVTPGFEFNVYSYSGEPVIDIVVINDSMNPTGGNMEASTTIEDLSYSLPNGSTKIKLNCVNNSNFDILISINMSLYYRSSSAYRKTNTINESSVSVPTGQTVVIGEYTNTSISGQNVSAYEISSFMIQRSL